MDSIITENNQRKQMPTRAPPNEIDGDKISRITAISMGNSESCNETKLDNDVSDFCFDNQFCFVTTLFLLFLCVI